MQLWIMSLGRITTLTATVFCIIVVHMHRVADLWVCMGNRTADSLDEETN